MNLESVLWIKPRSKKAEMLCKNSECDDLQTFKTTYQMLTL